jgi:hypothetical protein
MKLFNDTEDLQEYLPVNEGFTLENMQDDLEQAFSQFIYPRIAKDQIEDSLTKTDADNVELIRLLKRANANLGFMLHYAQAKVQLSNSGVTYAGKQEYSKQASDKDKEDLYKAIRAKGFQALGDMLAYLYQHDTVFTLWKASPECVNYNSLLIRNAKEFRLINGSFLLFTHLVPYIQDVEIELIETILDATLLSNLRTAIQDKSLDTLQNKLLTHYLQPAISNLALARAVSTNSIGRDDLGNITIYQDDTPDAPRSRRGVDLEKMNRWHKDLIEYAETRLGLMTTFLALNSAHFGLTNPNDVVTDFKPYRNDPDWSMAFF